MARVCPLCSPNCIRLCSRLCARRLQHLRKQQAARAIQRVVRRYLPIARHRRQVQAARERVGALTTGAPDSSLVLRVQAHMCVHAW